MGKSLQVRGTVQTVDIRTLNAEISELLKEDIDEVDYRSTKELMISSGTSDLEIVFTPEIPSGIAKFLYFKADAPVMVKINSVLAPAVPTTFLLHRGEIQKVYLGGGGLAAKVKLIALA